MATFSYKLRKVDAERSTIYLMIRWSGNNFRQSTGITVPKVAYNNGLLKKHKDIDDITDKNILLDSLRGKMRKSFDDYIAVNGVAPDMNDAIRMFHIATGKIKKPTTLTFYEYGQQFIKLKKASVNKKTGRKTASKTLYDYKILLEKLKVFNPRLDFQDFDDGFKLKFTEHLQATVNYNTIGKMFSKLNAVLNGAYKSGLMPRRIRYDAGTIDVDNSIALTEDELKAMEAKELIGREDLARDLFIIQCWTGLRTSDLKTLTTKKIEGKTINVIVQKTGKLATIPLFPAVVAVYNKYNAFPKPIAPRPYNELLRDVAGQIKLFDKWHTIEVIDAEGNKKTKELQRKELIVSSCGRRTFATRMYYKYGFPAVVVMNITAHESEVSFRRYVKDNRSDYAKMIEDRMKDLGL